MSCENCIHLAETRGVGSVYFCKLGIFDATPNLRTDSCENFCHNGIFDENNKTEKTINNRIEISYQNTADDKVKLVGVKLLSKPEIRKQYGEEVYRLYFFEGPHCFRSGDAVETEMYCVDKTDIVSKERFDDVVEACRQAGRRLSEIQKQVALYETKTIII